MFIFNWLHGALIGIVLMAGFSMGYWTKANVFPPKPPFNQEIAKFQTARGQIYSAEVLIYKKETYYPSDFVNKWLQNKLGLASYLKNLS